LPPSNYIKSKERVSIFESDTFIIYSTFNIVEDNIKKFIKKNDVEEDKLLLNKFVNIEISLDKRLVGIKNDLVLSSRLNFRTAELIQKRKCLVYNKVSKAFERKLFVTNYITNWWAGIRFSTQTGQLIMDLRTGAF
jgi:hypothetical protein